MAIRTIYHDFVDGMLRDDIIKFGAPFTLKDGRESSFYINMRDMLSETDLFEGAVHALGNLAAETYFSDDALAGQPVDRYLMGIPEAASEYAGAIAYAQSLPLLKRRVKQKTYGVPRPIEGRFTRGDQVILLDDVISSSKSKTDEIELLESQGLVTVGVAVLVDRQQGGRTELNNRGVDLVSAFTISDIARFALEKSIITEPTYNRLQSELDPQET